MVTSIMANCRSIALHDETRSRVARTNADSWTVSLRRGTHPGGGITGGSGQNAARAMVKALKP